MSLAQPNAMPEAPFAWVPPRPAPHAAAVSGVAIAVGLGIVACCVEGAGRKWLFPNPTFIVQGVFYFGKDVFFVTAALLAIRYPGRSRAVQSLKSTLAFVAVLIGMAAIVNIGDIYPIGAVLSVRNTLLLPWLALTIAPGLRSQRDIDFLLKTIGVVAIGEAILGGLQFYLPAGHILNQQVRATQAALAQGGRIRATGTFVFITGLGDLAMLASWAGVCLLLRRPRQLVLGGAFVVAALACASAAVSRGGILSALIVVVFSYLLLPTGRRDLIVLFLVLAVLGAYLAQDQPFSDEFGLAGATLARMRTAGDTFEGRAWSLVQQPLAAIIEAPGGVGLGVGQAAGQIMQAQSLTYEAELARAVVEIGVVGLLAVLYLRAAVLYGLWASCRGPVISRARAVFTPLRLSAMVLLGLYFAGLTYFNHVGATFAWLAMAIAMGTCEIEARQAPIPSPQRTI